MIDLFTIFSKGGIVLWCFQSTTQIFTPSVNALIRNVILQERTGKNSFEHNNLLLQYKLDNEFDLVFVVAYQKILKLSYIDKFLNDIQLEFRDRYKNVLLSKNLYIDYDFLRCFNETIKDCERDSIEQAKAPKQMRTFEESLKSKKNVASMIERKGGDEKQGKPKKVKIQNGIIEKPNSLKIGNSVSKMSITPPSSPESPRANESPKANDFVKDGGDEDVIQVNRLRLAQKMNKPKFEKKKSPKSPLKPEKAGKKPRIWDLGGKASDLAYLERTVDKPSDDQADNFVPDTQLIGQMQGGIKDLDVESSTDETDEEDNSDVDVNLLKSARSSTVATNNKSTSGGGGIFSMFKSLVGSKSLSSDDMKPVLEKFKDHLIAKNVAADIAQKLCDSVEERLEGKILGTFETVQATIKQTMHEALVQILSPKRRIDILRDCFEARKEQRPFVMTFCGVNGVGKSTNLAKICFWLIENNLRVLIAACDTFRAGAVEQLRTHTKHLNALHPPEKHGGLQMVQLYEKGYGKDAAGIAMEAIRYARDSKFNVVLIDTAGRMQDNEPLMRALTKLIKVNEPDLVLFVGEALVGNEAVDQLVKFNQALADHSNSTNPHLIDGIVLTKFDTIDDKVGAAISMTYITGQPIVFVGTGQTYTDLKALNSKAVVHALMK